MSREGMRLRREPEPNMNPASESPHFAGGPLGVCLLVAIALARFGSMR
jgi:hypothetical protein